MQPLTPLVAAMPRITIMDFRSVHKERETNYWCERVLAHQNSMLQPNMLLCSLSLLRCPCK